MLTNDRERNLKWIGWSIHLVGLTGIITVAALYQIVVSALIAHEQQTIATEAADKEQFLARSDEIRSEHRRLTKQLEELEHNAVAMRYRIPESPREAEFLKQVSQAADEEGLKIHKYERGSLERKATHSEFTVNLSCEGDYGALVGFLERLAHLPRASTVQRMTLTTGATDTYPVDLSLVLYYGAQSTEGPKS
jgi:Tfp pilus assembly protein PilO